MEMIQLQNAIVDKKTIQYQFAVSFGLEKYFSDKSFKIEYDEDITDIPDSILAVPFVSCVIPIVWITDSVLEIEELDEAFYNCLDNLKKGYEVMFPETQWKGKLNVKRVVPCERPKEVSKSAMLYSGGLDSTLTLINHLDEKPMLFSIWGSDFRIDNIDGWQKLTKVINEISDRFSLVNKTIRSNFREFDSEYSLDIDWSKLLKDGWWHGVKHGIALLGHVAPYAYLYGITNMYIAASSCPQNGQIRCASDPLLDNNVRYANCKVLHDGYEYNRQDKTHIITSFCREKKEYIPIHVCWQTQDGNNCCHCEKCYRTMTNILAEGELPQNYGFDAIDKWIPYMHSFLYENRNKYTINFKYNWPHIQKRIKENIKIVKCNKYWKYLKWILKEDFLNPQEMKKPISYNNQRNKIRSILSRIKNKFS